MRIAIIADPLDNQRAGVHIYTRELVKALLAHNPGHEYILIREQVDESLEGVQQVAIPNIRLPIGFASIRLFVMVPWILRRLKVDIVMEPAHFGPFNLPSRIKRITMIHDLTPILFPQYHRFHSQLLQRIFLKGILRRADLVLSNSQNTTRDLHRVYPFTAGKVKTILLGKENIYRPVASRRILEEQQIDQAYFLFLGTIEPRKNLLTLLEAYRRFREQYSQRVLLLIGGQRGWKSETFFEQLAQHPFEADIRQLGFVKKEYLPELYSHCTAMIYPSEYEGFGLPVLEALACGARVICANNSSLTEVGGNLAYFFETKNPDDLVRQMQAVLRDSEAVGGYRQKAVAWANRFSWEEHARLFHEAIEGL
ncbi:MAG: glycosyltransferase family 1 protein [Bacteroidota bacterium]